MVLKNRKPLKLMVCMSLIVALAISALGISVWASFENTHNNSGNQASDIVGVAQTQVGYSEGYNSYTKYGDWYGLPNSDWCAMFVSWCANQAGVDNSVFPSFALCSAGCDWFIKQGRFHYSGSYAPQAGDLIFYASYGNIYHVGHASPDYSTADNTTPAAADSDVEEDSDEEFFEDSDVTEIETNDAYSYIDDEDTDSEEEYTYDSEVIADSDSEIETDVSDNTDSDDVTTDTDDIIEEDSETDSVADSDSEADTDSSIESDVETDVPGYYEVVYSFEDTEFATGTGKARLYVVVTEGRDEGK